LALGRSRGNREKLITPHLVSSRGLSSAGRAPALQAGGHRFDPGRLHVGPAIRRAVGVRGKVARWVRSTRVGGGVVTGLRSPMRGGRQRPASGDLRPAPCCWSAWSSTEGAAAGVRVERSGSDRVWEQNSPTLVGDSGNAGGIAVLVPQTRTAILLRHPYRGANRFCRRLDAGGPTALGVPCPSRSIAG